MGVHVLECLHPKCLKDSCTQCKAASHIPLCCEEVDKVSDTALWEKVDEMMSKDVIRECNYCKVELIKLYGYNRVTCCCGITMCYNVNKQFNTINTFDLYKEMFDLSFDR